jgi:hypothetical protein
MNQLNQILEKASVVLYYCVSVAYNAYPATFSHDSKSSRVDSLRADVGEDLPN